MNDQFKILIILACVSMASLQVVAKPWRGIEPLQSTRVDVIRLLNQCQDDLRICSFELDHERVSIHFSSPLRTSNTRYTCVKDLPQGTVLRIDVTPKSPVR